jgi:hypothetical protein
LAAGGPAAEGGEADRIRQAQDRIFGRSPEAKKIYDERVKKDPELATNFEKWRAFVRELAQDGVIQMRGQRGG